MASPGAAMRLIGTAAMVAMLVLFTTSRPAVEASDGCIDVIYQLIPCMDYMTTGQNVTSDCCNALSTFNSTITNTTTLEASCACVIEIVGSDGINSTATAALPSECGLTWPYPINNQTDCTSLSW
ncbi:Non-specific lipid-transfer protein 1-like protein [Drosera capensis]